MRLAAIATSGIWMIRSCNRTWDEANTTQNDPT